MKLLPVVLGLLVITSCAAQVQTQRIELDTAPLPALPPTASKSTPFCPEGMIHVNGEFCPAVEQKCLQWTDKNQSAGANSGIGPMRCAEFEPSKCLAAREHKRFCIDKYEWPNKEGELPPVSMDWHEAKQSCQKVGKRLCTATEWTFACEGESMKPYPYGDGLHRDATACNIDRESMNPSLPRSEWPKHYKGVPSGSMKACVSPFGVFDMTGNVDEWVVNVGGRTDGDPYVSGLKGGYWGPIRARCRTMTTVHGPLHSFYQNGFRCCSNAPELKSF